MRFNKQECKDWIKVMQAFVEGKKILFKKNNYDGTHEWIDTDSDFLQITFSNDAHINPNEYYRISE